MTRSLVTTLLLLVVVAVASVVNVCHGFAPMSPNPQSFRRSALTVQIRMARPQDMKDPVDNEDSDSQEEGSETPAGPEKKQGLNLAQKAYWTISSAWSAVIITSGIVLSLGLLLNLCGYAYQFSLERGIEIETIPRMREINQFRALENARPPSSLPK